jgi:uncharacterized protein YuzE
LIKFGIPPHTRLRKDQNGQPPRPPDQPGVTPEGEASSVELTPNITAELNEKGDLIGIEILNASSYIRDAVMETVQAKMLRLSEAGAA